MVIEALQSVLGKEKVILKEEAGKRIGNIFGKPEKMKVKALVLPTNTNDVSHILKICNEHKQAVIPMGGLSNVVYSALSDGSEIGISLEKMNQIEKIDTENRTATVQSGVILQQLQQALTASDLLFGLDLGSKGSCMIGGNIATNAGGLQAVKYGVMRNLVLGLQVVLPDGSIISDLNSVMKNNTGYDLKQLFIGSEGTLGIITKAILKLDTLAKEKSTAFLGLSEFKNASKILAQARSFFGDKLVSFEILWPEFYEIMTNERSGNKKPFTETYPLYAIMEVIDSNKLLDTFLEPFLENNELQNAVIGTSDQERKQIWGIREKVDHIMNEFDPVFLFDISLPVSEMENYHKVVRENLYSNFQQVHYSIYGHMGDGNLHLMLNCGDGNIEAKAQVEKIVYEPLKNIPSSISAEHGIGLSKKKWLSFSRSENEIALMKLIKKAIDPNNIMNPGKIF